MADGDVTLSLLAEGFATTFFVLEPTSLLLLPLDPCFIGAASEFDFILHVESVFTASELLSCGEELSPHLAPP
jgi:hypothetical protein